METTSKQEAYGIVSRAIMDVDRLPRFSGQTQLVRALRGILKLALWRKS